MESQVLETSSTTTEQEAPEKKRSLARRLGRLIKSRVVNYVKNLDPRGKDKFWWTGNAISAATTASLFVFAPAERPIKTIATVALSVGLYAGEKAMERYRNKHWTEDERAEWAAKRQEKFPNGVSRIKRFLLGVAAGSMYGAAVGLPLEALHTHLESTSVKHLQRHHERPITQTRH